MTQELRNERIVSLEGRREIMMSEFDFKNGTRWKMSYEEYKKCYCPECTRRNCPHREAFRRVPVIDGGLGLCPNLKGDE